MGESMEESPSLRARLGAILPRANRAAAKTVGMALAARRGARWGRPKRVPSARRSWRPIRS